MPPSPRRRGSGPPLLLLHGFTDTRRTWELVLPALEREFEVMTPTLPGHAGGPPLPDPLTADSIVEWLERILDDAGWETAHVAGNSLGGHLALRLAERGRARKVVALAPAGGWAEGDLSWQEALAHFLAMDELVKQAAPQADLIMSTPEGRRRATQFTTVNYEHLPAELLADMLRGAAACSATVPFVELARRDGWPLDPVRVTCPVRFVWGTEDRLLPWPRAAARYQASFPQADWVVLDDVGHCPQLDVPLETAQLVLGFR